MPRADGREIPQEEWDTFVLACCYAEALARAGQDELAVRELEAARGRAAGTPAREPWLPLLLDDYDAAIADLAYGAPGTRS